MAVNFPAGWGLRINLTETLTGAQVYYPEPLLDLLPAGVPWAHWSPMPISHTLAGWSPCAALFGDAATPADRLVNVPTGACFLIGNDMQQLDVTGSAAKHSAQLDELRRWSAGSGAEWAWAAPQFSVANAAQLDQLSEWLHVMRQHYGYQQPHRLAIHVYGAYDTASFWAIVDRFETWHDTKLPTTQVIVSEFSGWPGTTFEQQCEVMTAGREYLERDYVDAVLWFSGYRYIHEGAAWGTELAQVDEAGGVSLTPLGEHWKVLQ